MSTPTPSDAGTGLNALSEDEFKQLVASGGTLTITQINARLHGIKVDAAQIEDLGLITRKERTSVHMAASDFRKLTLRMAARLLKAGNSST